MKPILSRLLLLTLFAFLPSGAKANDNFEILKKAKKIVFFGDSITYGGEYMVFFERWLTVNHPELGPEILNHSLAIQALCHSPSALPLPRSSALWFTRAKSQTSFSSSATT